MLATSGSVSIDLTLGLVTITGIVSARSTITVTLTGTQLLTNSNMRLALYRLNRNGVDGTLVATCQTFTGAANAFVGSLSLNTAEVVAAFTDMKVVRQGEMARFDLIIYDASQSLVFMVWDHLEVAYENVLVAATPSNVTPISAGTTTWGNFKLINGVLHVLSTDDGEYYPLTFAGTDGTIHEVIGETGIPP